MNIIEQAKLKEILIYQPETGEFFWRKTLSKAGCRITRPDGRKYWTIIYDGRHYAAHNLAWIYMMGSPPIHEIDHKNRDGSNNKWTNLRPATRGQNQANTRLYKNNSSGFRGVSRTGYSSKSKKPFRALIKFNGRKKHIGYFATAEEAYVAWKQVAVAVHGEFANV